MNLTIASLGNATDFGDFSNSSYIQMVIITDSWSGLQDRSDGSETDVIQYVQIMTTGNAVDFGNLLAGRRNISAASNGHGGLG